MPDTAPHHFFQEERRFAEVKQVLLGRVFEAWCGIRLAGAAPAPLHLIDLNAVAGVEKLAASAALQAHKDLMRIAIRKQILNEQLRFHLHDPAKTTLANLAQELALKPAYELLHTPPSFLNKAENRSMLENALEEQAAALFCMDPFSYGYAHEMLLKAVNAWQADLLLLLQPATLRKALAGKKVSAPLRQLFGERLLLISAFCRREQEKSRQEIYIMQHVESLLREKGFFTVLFRINRPGTGEALHYTLFASPDAAVCQAYKETILPFSDVRPDGVPLLVANEGPKQQLCMFPEQPVHTLVRLTETLAANAALYKFKTIEKIYELHQGNTPYSRENYLAAMELLRNQGKIELLNGKTMQTIRKPTFTAVVKYLA